MRIDTSANIQFSDDGNLVYFNVNTDELFDVNLSYPGMMNALKKAVRDSKEVVPFQTGLLRRSYSMDVLNQSTVRVYFDPSKIKGATRLGRVVTEYYPKYLKDKAKTFNWLDLVMRRFLKSLIVEIREMNKQKQREDALKLAALLLFYKMFNDNLKEKIKEGSGG